MTPAGPDLVVAHIDVEMTINGERRAGSTVVVYRVVNGLIVEGFDIPSTTIQHPVVLDVGVMLPGPERHHQCCPVAQLLSERTCQAVPGMDMINWEVPVEATVPELETRVYDAVNVKRALHGR